jgi:ferredoxin hydrogenase large subunit
MTYAEIRAMMKAKEVELTPCENNRQSASVYGMRFAASGGVTAAVIQCMKESGTDSLPQIHTANGAAECKKALLLLKAKRLSGDFVEGMFCEGGCVGGPCAREVPEVAKKIREERLSQADDRGILENLKQYSVK